MRELLKAVLFWALLVTLFLYFYAVTIAESNGFKKIRIENKKSGNGFVVRMKPEGWEVWTLDRKVETAKYFPKTSQLATQVEAGAEVGTQAVTPA